MHGIAIASGNYSYFLKQNNDAMSQIPKILQDLYLKNLAFFEKQNPQIHQVISHVKPDHSKIIISEDGKIDLNYNGRTIYGGDAINYVENEVAEFNKIYEKPYRVNSVNALAPGVYTSPRFFHRHINETLIQLFQTAGTVQPSVIHTGDRHDFLSIMGIGLGLHISELLDRCNIQNLLILETDYELLALSCFFTDWEDIYKRQSPAKNKSITLVLLDKQNLDNEQTGLWNELIKRAPHFPYNSVFYNHGRHDKYGKIIRKITEDIQMFLSLWGFYDDESNQLNHILHNINNEISLIPKKANFKWDKPVIVCGSGPSLDDRIEQLKAIRNDCILLSAGTSIDALLRYGLVPDFHVELESDYLVYNLLNNIPDEISQKISLICAIQCSPLLNGLFKETYAFVKDSLSIGGILENTEDKLREPTPTCVNAAISLAFQYQAKEIYLFGTDFGFYNTEQHHSKASLYIDDSISEDAEYQKELDEVKVINNKMMSENFEHPGYKGPCLTTGTYYTTKRRVDMLINYNLRDYEFTIYNCCDGLIIDKSTHISENTVIKPSSSTLSNQDEIKQFSLQSRKTKKTMQADIKDVLYPAISELCSLYHGYIERMEPNTESLSAACWALSNYVNIEFKNKYDTLMYFIRGTIWHYTLAGYSVAYACEVENQKEVIEKWKERFLNFLEELPNDLLDNLNKDRNSQDEDIQLRKTIRE